MTLAAFLFGCMCVYGYHVFAVAKLGDKIRILRERAERAESLLGMTTTKKCSVESERDRLKEKLDAAEGKLRKLREVMEQSPGTAWYSPPVGILSSGEAVAQMGDGTFCPVTT